MELSPDLFVDAALRIFGYHPAVYNYWPLRYLLTGAGVVWGGIKLGWIHADQRQDKREIREIQTYLHLRLPMPETIPSPNYTKGRLGRKVRKVVIHSMAGHFDSSIRSFQSPKREASAHYMVAHDGREVQMVDEKNTAWHCGARKIYWLRYPFNNADTIGIECEGGDFAEVKDGPPVHHPLQDAGYAATAKRVAQIHKDYGLGIPTRSTVVMHREMPGTATACPTGVDIDRVVREAAEAYVGVTVTTTVPVHAGGENVVAPITRKTYAPFETDLNYKAGNAYSSEVARIQSFLIDKGYMARGDLDWNGQTGAGSGWYGKKTSAAVDRFQKAHGIKAYPQNFGWWYPVTRAAANKDLTI